MRRTRSFVLCLTVLSLACGKSSEKGERSADAPGAAAPPAASAQVVTALEAKGFRILQNRRAPAQRSGTAASAVVYRAGDGKAGGAMYVARPEDDTAEQIVWHWYFDDGAPDSVTFMEINRDGLWDARFYAGDRKIDMIQGESFWLLGRARSGIVAMKGATSATDGRWKCFDGDSTTAWRAQQSPAFLELAAPLGIESGEVEVQLAREGRPQTLDVYVNGSKVQTIDLADTTARQRFTLDPAVRESSSIRIEVGVGTGGPVEISEMEIR